MMSKNGDGAVGDSGVLQMESIWKSGFPKMKLRVFQFDRSVHFLPWSEILSYIRHVLCIEYRVHLQHWYMVLVVLGVLTDCSNGTCLTCTPTVRRSRCPQRLWFPNGLWPCSRTRYVRQFPEIFILEVIDPIWLTLLIHRFHLSLLSTFGITFLLAVGRLFSSEWYS